MPSPDPTPVQDAEVLMAKHGLYSICFQESISIAGETNPSLRWDVNTAFIIRVAIKDGKTERRTSIDSTVVLRCRAVLFLCVPASR